MSDGFAVLSSGDDGAMHVWEPRSGAPLQSFKGSVACRQGVVAVAGAPSPHGARVCQYVVACQGDKPFVNVWAWGKVRRFFVLLSSVLFAFQWPLMYKTPWS